MNELAEGAAGEPCDWKELAAVSVPRELQADAGLLDDGQAIGHMVEQNAGLAGSMCRLSSAERIWSKCVDFA